jgi:hypothetical protein
VQPPSAHHQFRSPRRTRLRQGGHDSVQTAQGVAQLRTAAERTVQAGEDGHQLGRQLGQLRQTLQHPRRGQIVAGLHLSRRIQDNGSAARGTQEFGRLIVEETPTRTRTHHKMYFCIDDVALTQLVLQRLYFLYVKEIDGFGFFKRRKRSKQFWKLVCCYAQSGPPGGLDSRRSVCPTEKRHVFSPTTFWKIIETPTHGKPGRDRSQDKHLQSLARSMRLHKIAQNPWNAKRLQRHAFLLKTIRSIINVEALKLYNVRHYSSKCSHFYLYEILVHIIISLTILILLFHSDIYRNVLLLYHVFATVTRWFGDKANNFWHNSIRFVQQ